MAVKHTVLDTTLEHLILLPFSCGATSLIRVTGCRASECAQARWGATSHWS